MSFIQYKLSLLNYLMTKKDINFVNCNIYKEIKIIYSVFILIIFSVTKIET